MASSLRRVTCVALPVNKGFTYTCTAHRNTLKDASCFQKVDGEVVCPSEHEAVFINTLSVTQFTRQSVALWALDYRIFHPPFPRYPDRYCTEQFISGKPFYTVASPSIPLIKPTLKLELLREDKTKRDCPPTFVHANNPQIRERPRRSYFL